MAPFAFTPASPGDYLVIASATHASDANLGAMRRRLDGSTMSPAPSPGATGHGTARTTGTTRRSPGDLNREAPNAAGWQHAGLAQRETLAAVAATWKWRTRAETAGTTVNVGSLAIAVLQLEATPALARRRYMAIAA